MEYRPPNDIDVVTFYRLPVGTSQLILRDRDPNLFDHPTVRATYHVDAFLVSLDDAAERLVAASAYWYSLWSHRRNLAWKGYIELELRGSGDAAALALLKASTSAGGDP